MKKKLKTMRSDLEVLLEESRLNIQQGSLLMDRLDNVVETLEKKNMAIIHEMISKLNNLEEYMKTSIENLRHELHVYVRSSFHAKS